MGAYSIGTWAANRRNTVHMWKYLQAYVQPQKNEGLLSLKCILKKADSQPLPPFLYFVMALHKAFL